MFFCQREKDLFIVFSIKLHLISFICKESVPKQNSQNHLFWMISAAPASVLNELFVSAARDD